MKSKYKFRGVVSGVSAVTVGNRLMHLYENNNNQITDDIVVKDAKENKSYYCSYFDWNKTVAANKWLKHQAKQLINNIVVNVEVADKKGKLQTLEVRVFHNVRDEGNPYSGKNNSRFITLDHVYEDPNSLDYVMRTAYSDLVAFKNKYSTLNILKPYSDVLKEIIDNLKPVE